MMWYKIQDQQVEIKILVKPNAKKTVLLGVGDEELLISLHAKPHQGEANKELISYLAGLFRMPKTKIILKSGEKSRHKRVVLPLTAGVTKFISNNSQI